MSRSVYVICLAAIGLFGQPVFQKADMDAVAETEKKKIVIGLVPEQNLFVQIKRYDPLAAYLSKKTGFEVKLKIVRQYGDIIDQFSRNEIDAAFLGSFTYILAHARLGVRVIVRPEKEDSSSTYQGYIFVRRKSGITGPLQMPGKRFVLVDRATTAGYLLPLAYLRKAGLDCGLVLRHTYFSGTHEDAVYEVLAGRADIGAAKSTIYDRVAETNAAVANELVILERSPAIPENGLAVGKNLDEAAAGRLSEVLLQMQNDDEALPVLKALGVRRFIATTDSDYASVYRYARQLGLHLATYAYTGDRPSFPDCARSTVVPIPPKNLASAPF